ncbi:hypothetical protein HOH67_00650 [Candidatus Peregrinibacteria bacterium]|jgi:hypothetical protein|nr:hypothetical protein [Candidatus Peregrinibacteria bacterium]
MGNFTLYTDIYPSGFKSIIKQVSENVGLKKIKPVTGIISKHDTSNGYWKDVLSAADKTVLVEPPLTKFFYRKEVNSEGELVVERTLRKEHMPYPEFWGEIVRNSIGTALRKPTKGEAIISPVIDTYEAQSMSFEQLKRDEHYMTNQDHDFELVKFNMKIASYVVDLAREKNDSRKVFAGLFLDRTLLEDDRFYEIFEGYDDLDLGGYFLVTQGIDYGSDVEGLQALHRFISTVQERTPDRKIILYRTGMLGALYSALFPNMQIGSTYGLPYRDSYNIRNINPVKETRPLKFAKRTYAPDLLTTVKLPDALRAWGDLNTELDPREAEVNFTAMVKMAELTQRFAHELNSANDKKSFLEEKLNNGIQLVRETYLPSQYASHLRNWLNLLKRV